MEVLNHRSIELVGAKNELLRGWCTALTEQYAIVGTEIHGKYVEFCFSLTSRILIGDSWWCLTPESFALLKTSADEITTARVARHEKLIRDLNDHEDSFFFRAIEAFNECEEEEKRSKFSSVSPGTGDRKDDI